MDAMLGLTVLGLLVGAGLIVWLVSLVRASARRLDRRIEDYHAEGPPADPYSELAKIMAEDRQTRPGSQPKKRGSGAED